jgi:hypothetical protein
MLANGGMEAQLKMNPWRVCRPMVADSYHFGEQQDLDRIRIKGKSLIRICVTVKSWTRIRTRIKSDAQPCFTFASLQKYILAYCLFNDPVSLRISFPGWIVRHASPVVARFS